MNADQFPESHKQLARLKKRADKYLRFAERVDIKRQTKVLSLAIMISIERVGAVKAWRESHSAHHMSRWTHFKKAIWK